MDGTAHFSRDRRYRYTLTRRWDRTRESLTFVMLNPSRADAYTDDATVRRCIGYAKRWGYGGLVVKNLYALISTDPAGLWEVDDPVGPENDDALAVALQWAPRLIVAWGANARPERVARFWELAGPRYDERDGWGPVEALRLNKDGSPAHPLRLPGELMPIPVRRP